MRASLTSGRRAFTNSRIASLARRPMVRSSPTGPSERSWASHFSMYPEILCTSAKASSFAAFFLAIAPREGGRGHEHWWEAARGN